VAILLVLSFLPTAHDPALEVVLSKVGLGKINEAAEQHLEQQRELALKGFLLLSVLKVGLVVLRSYEVGVVLNVKIGDLAVAVYDYVNFAWKPFLAAFFCNETFSDMSELLIGSASWSRRITIGPNSAAL
jgi:hypothetical protein